VKLTLEETQGLSRVVIKKVRQGDASEFSAKLATLPRTEGVCWAWGEEERGWLQGTELQVQGLGVRV
jgi:hypothetical protein